MLVHVNGACSPGIRITAGGIVPGSSRARCKPDDESIKENAIRIVRIHEDSLVVPVQWVISGTDLSGSECAALGTLHEGIACTAIRSSPCCYLTARVAITAYVT